MIERIILVFMFLMLASCKSIRANDKYYNEIKAIINNDNLAKFIKKSTLESIEDEDTKKAIRDLYIYDVVMFNTIPSNSKKGIITEKSEISKVIREGVNFIKNVDVIIYFEWSISSSFSRRLYFPISIKDNNWEIVLPNLNHEQLQDFISSIKKKHKEIFKSKEKLESIDLKLLGQLKDLIKNNNKYKAIKILRDLKIFDTDAISMVDYLDKDIKVTVE